MSLEKRVPIEQAVVDRFLQDVLRDSGPQQRILAPQVLIVCLPPQVRTNADCHREHDREGQHARNQMQCQSSGHGLVLEKRESHRLDILSATGDPQAARGGCG